MFKQLCLWLNGESFAAHCRTFRNLAWVALVLIGLFLSAVIMIHSWPFGLITGVALLAVIIIMIGMIHYDDLGRDD